MWNPSLGHDSCEQVVAASASGKPGYFAPHGHVHTLTRSRKYCRRRVASRLELTIITTTTTTVSFILFQFDCYAESAAIIFKSCSSLHCVLESVPLDTHNKMAFTSNGLLGPVVPATATFVATFSPNGLLGGSFASRTSDTVMGEVNELNLDNAAAALSSSEDTAGEFSNIVVENSDLHRIHTLRFLSS